MNTYSSDEFNALVGQVRDLSNKVDLMSDSIALIDASVNKTKYITKLLDVNVSYPAENDVLVYDKTGKWKNAQYDEIGLKPGEGGESDVYVIAIGDETPATNENVYSAARTIEDWVSSKNDDTIEGNITFNEGKSLYINSILSRNASEGSDTGSGLIYKITSTGKSYLELDELIVRKDTTFNTLEIKKITAVSGNLIVSPASNYIIKVEETSLNYEDSVQSVWRCIFREEDEKESGTITQIKTDFQPGDLVRILQFNIQEGIQEDVKNRFYWGKVLGVGKNYIDLSKTDIDPSTNTQPMAGDTLVMYGHKGNTQEDIKRLNAISITSYSENAPAIQMYQGLNDYSTENKAVIEMAYDTTESQQQAYMNIFGRMYIGTKDKETSYVKYDPTANDGAGLLTVKASIIVKDPENESDVTLIEGGYIRTSLVKADDIIANIGVITNELRVGEKFSVDKEGNLVASDANISGVINATSGTFENVIINGSIKSPFKYASFFGDEIADNLVIPNDNKNNSYNLLFTIPDAVAENIGRRITITFEPGFGTASSQMVPLIINGEEKFESLHLYGNQTIDLLGYGIKGEFRAWIVLTDTQPSKVKTNKLICSYFTPSDGDNTNNGMPWYGLGFDRTSTIQTYLNGFYGIHFRTGSGSMDLDNSGGNLTVSGRVNESSDERLKEIKESLEIPLEQIVNSPIVRYSKKSDTQGNTEVGGIAQYMKDILPETVTEDAQGYLSMSYSRIGYIYSVAVAKELQKANTKISELENKINELEIKSNSKL